MDDQNSTGAGAPCHCRTCGAGFCWERAPGQRGRPPLYCSADCRKGNKIQAEAQGTCGVCGLGYTRSAGRLGIYCSKACQSRRKRVRAPREPELVSLPCCGCGETKNRKTWHRDDGDTGDSLRYCCMRCYHGARAKVAGERAALVRIGANWSRCHREDAANKRSLIASEVAALRRIAAYVERPAMYSVACACCGAEHQARRTKGNHRRVCAPCTEGRKRAAKRVANARRKARQRGAHSERIDPIKVFEAEGWICYLCGVLTSKAKRGTFDPLAPELEHVIPLSKGGGHVRGNVRCACRRCNGLKSDALPVAA